MADRIEGVKKLFTSKSARVETNKGDTYYRKIVWAMSSKNRRVENTTTS